MYIYKTDLYLYIKNVYRSINQSTMYFKGRGLRAGSQCNREMKLFFFSFFLFNPSTHRQCRGESSSLVSDQRVRCHLLQQLSHRNRKTESVGGGCDSQACAVSHRWVSDLASGVNCLGEVDRLLMCSGDDSSRDVIGCRDCTLKKKTVKGEVESLSIN